MPNMNPEQVPDARAGAGRCNKNFEEVTPAIPLKWRSRSTALPELQEQALHDRLPGRLRFRSSSLWLPRASSSEAAAKIKETCTARCLRSCLPAGEPVRVLLACAASRARLCTGRLERFVADRARENSTEKAVKPELTAKARLPSSAGPAGLTCAGDLACMGL